jgi:hypothetical protein
MVVSKVIPHAPTSASPNHTPTGSEQVPPNRGHGFPQGKGLLDDVDDAVSGGTAVGEEDDILGVLSKPVEVVITEKVFPLPFLYLFGFLLLFSREIGCKFA